MEDTTKVGVDRSFHAGPWNNGGEGYKIGDYSITVGGTVLLLQPPEVKKLAGDDWAN
jgi:hypothetical protein